MPGTLKIMIDMASTEPTNESKAPATTKHLAPPQNKPSHARSQSVITFSLPMVAEFSQPELLFVQKVATLLPEIFTNAEKSTALIFALITSYACNPVPVSTPGTMDSRRSSFNFGNLTPGVRQILILDGDNAACDAEIDAQLRSNPPSRTPSPGTSPSSP